MDTFQFITDGDNVGKRLDKYLSEKIPDFSRSRIQAIIDDGGVFVEGKPRKASYKLEEGNLITLTAKRPTELTVEPVNIPIDILYEDEDVIVVNKPKGMPVHPSNGHTDDTLVNALLYSKKDSLSGINGILRPGIVHRIDMDTTGSLIVCKNDWAHQSIAEQIAKHSIKRYYVGVVHGRIKEADFTIDAPIGRDPKNRQKNAIVSNGKRAVTRGQIIDVFNDFSYVGFTLETGRTHQIRVHMASIKHPLLGDAVYGPKKCPYKLQGQTLHAKTIGFFQPTTNQYIEIDAPLPDYFKKLLNSLGPSVR